MSAPAPSTSQPSATRYAVTALDKQRGQLERLFKDVSKPAYVPPPPKEKTIRPAREMMKNVQGSSAGAGSGEFHVYKASRRREYERLKLLEETTQKELVDAEFEGKRLEREETAEAKTAKNRLKRQKKKERGKGKGSQVARDNVEPHGDKEDEHPVSKKRRLISGKEVVFRQPGEDDEEEEVGPSPPTPPSMVGDPSTTNVEDTRQLVELPKVTIHED